jgi:hypothetical protein
MSSNLRDGLWWAWWVIAWVVFLNAPHWWAVSLGMFLWNPFEHVTVRSSDLRSDQVVDPPMKTNLRKP